MCQRRATSVRWKETPRQRRNRPAVATTYAPTPAARRPPYLGIGTATLERSYWACVAVTTMVGAFLSLYRLGIAGWGNDELIYRNAGRAYFAGDLTANPEHPPLVKYILGTVQWIFGSNATAVRLPGAIAGLLTGLFLFLLARNIAGRWAALSVLACWSFLPHPFGAMRVERMALLEPFMVLFVVMAIWAAERWASEGGWDYACVTGFAVGLATACKVPGVLALAIVLVVALVLGTRDGRAAVQFVAICGLAAGVFLVTYLPYGSGVWDTLGQMWIYQERHSANGHPIVVAGTTYAHPPWWAAAWLFWSKGPLTALAYAGLVIAAPMLLARRLATFVLAFLGIWIIFFAFVTAFLQRHYLYAVSPALALACGIVLTRLARGGRWQRAGLVGAVLLLAAGSQTVIKSVVHLQPQPSAKPEAYARAAQLIDEAGLGTAHAVVFGTRPLAAAYLPAVTFRPQSETVDPSRDVIIADSVFMRSRYHAWTVSRIREQLALRGAEMDELAVGGGVRVFLPRQPDELLADLNSRSAAR